MARRVARVKAYRAVGKACPGARICGVALLREHAVWLSVRRGADALVDSAVLALSQLTDPARLASLPDDAAVEAQLGPALGWIHVARRHDVSPESLIARAFARNGLTGERRGDPRKSPAQPRPR